jgi:hypothetical protein
MKKKYIMLCRHLALHGWYCELNKIVAFHGPSLNTTTYRSLHNPVAAEKGKKITRDRSIGARN